MDTEATIENIKINIIHKSRPIVLYGVSCAPQTKPSKEPVSPAGIMDIFSR